MSSFKSYLSKFLDENGNLAPLYKQEGCESGPADDWFSAAMTYTMIFTFVVYIFEAHLDDMQYAAYKVKDFPARVKEVVMKVDSKGKKGTRAMTGEEKKNEVEAEDDDKDGEDGLLLPRLQKTFESAQEYGVDKMRFQMFSQLYGLVEGIAFMICGFMPYVWDLSAGIYNGGEIGTSLVFLGIVTVIGTITQLPFELYSTFSIEKKHGFNKQTLGLFFSDKVKSLFLTIVIGGPFVSLMLKIIEWGGDNFYLYLWAFMFTFSVFMMTIVPTVIMPMFNKYEPLKDCDLRDRTFALAKKIEYPLTKLFVMDGSKRSSHSNAFMFGFGSNKRVVLFDTLLKQASDDEILAILGHEFGHWKLGHNLINFVVSQLYTGASFYAFSQCINSPLLYSSFGFEGNNVPTMIALLLFFQTLWAPIDKMLSFIMTINSRSMEFQADKFGYDLGMGQDLQTGLIKLCVENKSGISYNKLYSAYHHSHPPLDERLSVLIDYDKKDS